MNALEKIKKNQSPTPSKWEEFAKTILENKEWMKKSQKIAFAVLSEMDKQNLTQRNLAEKLGFSPQYLSKLLKGTENLTLETITKFEKALDIELINIQYFSTTQTIYLSNSFGRDNFEEYGFRHELSSQKLDANNLFFDNQKTA